METGCNSEAVIVAAIPSCSQSADIQAVRGSRRETVTEVGAGPLECVGGTTGLQQRERGMIPALLRSHFDSF